MISKTSKKKTGDRGERRAARWLFLHGYRILERNYVCGKREIDVIAAKGNVVAFVEVKTRRDVFTTSPGDAVTAAKRRNLISAAKSYALDHDVSGKVLRFDIAEVPLKGRINYIKDAFS